MTAEQILDQVAAAMGVDSFYGRGSIYQMRGAISVGDMRGTLDMTHDPVGDRFRISVELPAFASVAGFDGETYWTVDTNGKLAKRLDRSAIEGARVESRFAANLFLAFRQEYSASIVTAEPDYVLRLVDKRYAAEPHGVFEVVIDRKTMLIKERRGVFDGNVRVERLVSFESYDGVIFPTEIHEVDVAGNLTVTRVDSIVFPDDPTDSPFLPPEGDVRDYRFPDGATHVVVPISIPEHHIFINVAIAGRDYKFVLDTGAGSTVLASDVVCDLGLEILGRAMGQGVSGAQEFEIVAVPEMRIGAITMVNQRVVALDIERIRNHMPNVAGFLGMDFLNRFVVKFDYVRQEIEVFERSSFTYAGSGAELPIEGACCAMTIDDVEGMFTIDTGSPALDLYGQFLEKKGLAVRADLPEITRIAGIGSTPITFRLATCSRVTIGPYTLENVPLGFTKAQVGAFANMAHAGNAGAVIWRRFITYFDYSGQRLIIEPNGDLSAPSTIDRSGLKVEANDRSLHVAGIVSRSPAAALGIEVGDTIERVDGRDVSIADLSSVRAMLFGEAGRVIQIDLRRPDGSSYEAYLLLCDYIPSYRGV